MSANDLIFDIGVIKILSSNKSLSLIVWAGID